MTCWNVPLLPLLDGKPLEKMREPSGLPRPSAPCGSSSEQVDQIYVSIRQRTARTTAGITMQDIDHALVDPSRYLRKQLVSQKK